MDPQFAGAAHANTTEDELATLARRQYPWARSLWRTCEGEGYVFKQHS
jgi:hypothetical protein